MAIVLGTKKNTVSASCEEQSILNKENSEKEEKQFVPESAILRDALIQSVLKYAQMGHASRESLTPSRKAREEILRCN